MTTIPPQLIIFDCDGVLVDSERLTNHILLEMLNELGLSLTLNDMFELFVGHSLHYFIELSSRMLGKPLPDAFVDELLKRKTTVMKTELHAICGIHEVLNTLTIPYCAASNGLRSHVENNLTITGLWSRFAGRVFSIEDVSRGKPYPDIYLLAAKHFDVHPSRCIVIEDTPTGVTAGVAAGMQVLGYTGSMPSHRLIEAGASQVFEDMRQLPELLNC